MFEVTVAGVTTKWWRLEYALMDAVTRAYDNNLPYTITYTPIEDDDE